LGLKKERRGPNNKVMLFPRRNCNDMIYDKKKESKHDGKRKYKTSRAWITIDV
jgi:hypothetical protein